MSRRGWCLSVETGQRHGSGLASLAVSVASEGDATAVAALVLYPWLRADADAWGMVDADPERIAWGVVPWSGMSPQDIAQALARLDVAGLIYRVEGTAAVAIVGWDEDQPDVRQDRRGTSPLPTPSQPPVATGLDSSPSLSVIRGGQASSRTPGACPALPDLPVLPEFRESPSAPSPPPTPPPAPPRETPHQSVSPIPPSPPEPGRPTDELTRLVAAEIPHLALDPGLKGLLADVSSGDTERARRAVGALRRAIDAHRRTRPEEGISSVRWVRAVILSAIGPPRRSRRRVPCPSCGGARLTPDGLMACGTCLGAGTVPTEPEEVSRSVDS